MIEYEDMNWKFQICDKNEKRYDVYLKERSGSVSNKMHIELRDYKTNSVVSKVVIKSTPVGKLIVEDEHFNRWILNGTMELCRIQDEAWQNIFAILKKVLSMKNCAYCTDCENCTNCYHCENCIGCTDCKDCICCKNCSNCVRNFSCENCIDCFNCNYCRTLKNAHIS